MKNLNTIVTNLNAILTVIGAELGQNENTKLRLVEPRHTGVPSGDEPVMYRGGFALDANPEVTCTVIVTVGSAVADICEECRVVLEDPSAYGFKAINEDQLDSLLEHPLTKLANDTLITGNLNSVLESMDVTLDHNFNYSCSNTTGLSRFIVIGDQEIAINIAYVLPVNGT